MGARVALQAPPQQWRDRCELHELDGVSLYLSPGLVLQAPALTIKAVGFWKLRWLVIQGLAPAAACAF